MELKTFIAETILEIMHGIESAQATLREAKSSGRIVPITIKWDDKHPSILGYQNNNTNPILPLEFDIAVTVSDEGKAGAGIKVLGLGANAGLSQSSSAVSRVKFMVPVILPQGVMN